MKTRPLKYATKQPYMQINRKDMVSWLIFDLDHSNPFIWEDNNLPPPNYIVQNRKNGHSHIYYAISPVCTSNNARSKPIQYMKAVYEAMAARLNADASYSGPVAKTPGHKWWLTSELHPEEYSLGELADYVELSVKPYWGKEPNLDDVAHSRHCLLFEETRFYSYSIVNREKESSSYQHFYNLVEAFAYNKNNYKKRGFSTNLTDGQVKATVKSIARWTWDKYTGTGNFHRGVMRLDKALPLNIRQQLSAERTHKNRNKATKRKITAALRILKDRNEKVTQTAIAKLARVTRQTISKYKELIESVKPVEIISLGEVMTHTNNVKYGVHQITSSTVKLENSDINGYIGNISGTQFVFIKPPD